MIPPPPISTLFPYTTLFRSLRADHGGGVERVTLHDRLDALERAFHEPVVNRLMDERPTRAGDRKSTRLNSSHITISYAVFCLKKKISKYPEIKANDNQPTNL